MQKLLAWRPWGRRNLEQDGVRETERYTLLQLKLQLNQDLNLDLVSWAPSLSDAIWTCGLLFNNTKVPNLERNVNNVHLYEWRRKSIADSVY